MSYSRRQLYAFGEPLGDGATRREVGGKVIYGGGGGNSTPEKQTTVVDIPDWAKPYAKESLGKAAALSKSPYQAYGGERIAQFNPMQKQAFGRAENQQVAGQVGMGTDLAGTAGLMGLTGGYQPGQFGSQMGQYMSPYMDSVVQQQMDSAQRQADIASTQRGAQAVKAGAFGGSRQAIENAEANRALASQKGQIQTQGLQSAYDRATDMYGREQALAEQSRQAGLGTALQSAQTLGQLGGQQFGQQMDITGQQAQFGGQQRQATQDILSQRYQDFQNQQRAPYDQLAFMSSMIRGTPLGQTTTMYSPPPSTTSQLIGLGTAAAGAYGAYKGAAGGEIPSYAVGGIANLKNQPEMAAAAKGMDDQQVAETAGMAGIAGLTAGDEQRRRNELRMAAEGQKAPASMTKITSVLSQMSDAELQQYAKLNKSDPYTMALVVSEANRRKEGGMPSQEQPKVVDQQIAGMAMPEDQGIAQLPVGNMEFAGGGIIAFQAGGPIRLPAGTPPQEVERVRMENPGQEVMVEGLGLVSAAPTSGIAALADGSDNRFRRGPAVAGITDQPPAKVAAETADVDRMPAPPGVGGLGGIMGMMDKEQARRIAVQADIDKQRAADVATARGELSEEEKMAREFGSEREARLKKQEEGLDKSEKNNLNMTLIEVGLAMMAGESPNALKNIAAGAQQGLKGFETRLSKIQSGREKVDESMARLAEIREEKLSAVGAEKRRLNALERQTLTESKTAQEAIASAFADKKITLTADQAKQANARSFEVWKYKQDRADATEKGARSEAQAVSVNLRAIVDETNNALRDLTPGEPDYAALASQRDRALAQLAQLSGLKSGSTATSRLRFDARGNPIQ
jgi:hypothetical protein